MKTSKSDAYKAIIILAVSSAISLFILGVYVHFGLINLVDLS
jgi:hypothetical protein